MLFRVFVAAVIGGMCFAALAHLPSPAVVGVRSEPATLLFYGGMGLLAGLFAVGAMVCGIVLGLRRIQHRTTRPPGRVAILAYRLIWVVVGLGLLILLRAMVLRLGVTR